MDEITKIEGINDEHVAFEVDDKFVSNICTCRLNDVPHYRVSFHPEGVWAGGDILVNAAYIATVTLGQKPTTEDPGLDCGH